MSKIRMYSAIRADNLQKIRGYVWQGSSCTLIIPSTCGVGYDSDTCKLSTAAYEVIPETLCQSTGKTDSRYNDIYEGDLVESNFSGAKNIYEVVFVDGSPGLKWVEEGEDNFMPFASLSSDVYLKRISNIHDETEEKHYKNYPPEEAVKVLSEVLNNISTSKCSRTDTKTYTAALTTAIKVLKESVSSKHESKSEESTNAKALQEAVWNLLKCVL